MASGTGALSFIQPVGGGHGTGIRTALGWTKSKSIALGDECYCVPFIIKPTARDDIADWLDGHRTIGKIEY